jgi:hypothetical protein
MPPTDQRDLRHCSQIGNHLLSYANLRNKNGPEGPVLRSVTTFPSHACGEVLLPLGETTGGHKVPGVGLIPGLLGDVPLLPWPPVLPGVDGFELDEPEFGVEPGVEFVAPGRVPHGEPLGEPLGLFGVFGLTVDGCVLLPGTVVFGVPLGEVDPGVACFVVPAGGVAVPAGGVAALAGGVAGLAGGVVVPAGGVAGEPGVEVCPGLPEPPGLGAPPDGAVCASAQVPQHSTTDNNANLDFDIKSPAFCSEPSSDFLALGDAS